MRPDPTFHVDPATGFGAWRDDRIHSTATQGLYEVVCSATREGRDLAVQTLEYALANGLAVRVEDNPTPPAGEMHVVLFGNPADGFTAYGPFANAEDAVEFGSTTSLDQWCTMRLHSPEEA